MSVTRRYLLFLAALAGLTLLLMAVGYLPTRSLGGPAALAAMVLACGVSFVGSAVGGLPVATVRGSGSEALQRITAAMFIRLMVVAALGGGLYWLLRPERRPFLLWLAISYLVLLAADSGFARSVFRRL